MTPDVRAEKLTQRLQHGLLIGDGAMGTTLSAEGHTPGRSLEILNVEEPDRVRAAHRGFLAAGSDVIQTNTFQGSRPALDRHGLADRTVELNAAGAALAREVAGERAFVGTGAIIIPGVRIGRGAIVAAGATVIRDVEDGARVIGSPARPMK